MIASLQNEVINGIGIPRTYYGLYSAMGDIVFTQFKAFSLDTYHQFMFSNIGCKNKSYFFSLVKKDDN